MNNVTRLGDFYKVLTTTFLAKEAQMIGNFLGYFLKPHYYVSYSGYFLGNFWKNRLLFTPYGHTAYE